MSVEPRSLAHGGVSLSKRRAVQLTLGSVFEPVARR